MSVRRSLRLPAADQHAVLSAFAHATNKRRVSTGQGRRWSVSTEVVVDALQAEQLTATHPGVANTTDAAYSR